MNVDSIPCTNFWWLLYIVIHIITPRFPVKAGLKSPKDHRVSASFHFDTFEIRSVGRSLSTVGDPSLPKKSPLKPPVLNFFVGTNPRITTCSFGLEADSASSCYASRTPRLTWELEKKTIRPRDPWCKWLPLSTSSWRIRGTKTFVCPGLYYSLHWSLTKAIRNRALSPSYGLPLQIAKGMGKMDIIYVLTPFTPCLVNLDWQGEIDGRLGPERDLEAHTFY